MKIKFFLVAVMSIGLIACAQNKKNGPESSADASSFKNFNDSVSYALGVQLGQSAKTDTIKINFDLYQKGYQDGNDSTKLAFPDSVLSKIYSKLQAKVQNRQMAEQQAAEQKLENKAKELQTTNTSFLEQNKKKSGVKVTKSGLQYEVLKEGTGRNVEPDDVLKVKFFASFTNGEIFDSLAMNKPMDFPARGLFPGWAEAALLMKKGGKYRFVFPPEIAFKDRPAGPIPPNTPFIFTMELLDMKKINMPQGVQIQPSPQQMPPQQMPPMKNK